MHAPRPLIRLAIFLAAFVALGGALELAFRLWRPVLRATSHRSLFKVALLERRPPQDIIFFGTSRATEALRPSSFVSELSARGAPKLSAFNVSNAFSSMEILEYVTTRFSTSPGLKLAVLEISNPQLESHPLPWATAPADAAGFDGAVFSFLEQRSALIAERKALVLNSLGRLAVVALLGGAVDGTESIGRDFLRAAAGVVEDVPPEQFSSATCLPRALDPEPASLGEYQAQRDTFVAIAQRLKERGVAVAFYVPPTRAADLEGTAHHRALLSSIAAKTSAPVLDFSDCVLPASYFRDATHLSKLGGSHFSRLVVEQLWTSPEIRRAVGAHALP